MNFARFCPLNAGKLPTREFLIESHPSRNLRRALTWSELEERTNKIANYLRNLCGIGKGDVVQHMMTNSLEWYITYMGVLKTGAAISPLNFRFATSDIKYACDVIGSKVFIIEDTFVPRVEPIRGEMDYCEYYIVAGDEVPPDMTSFADIMVNGDPTPVLVDVEDDDMAELMFTSGTTGAPKPVCHTHGTLFWIGMGNALTYNEGYSSIYLAPHPFYHSGTFFLSFPSYIGAGKILMPMELEPEHYLRSIADEKCTGGWNTVPTWSDVIDAIKEGAIDIRDYDLSALRHIEIGAQPVPYVLLEDSKRLFPDVAFGNIYGITEGGGGGLINCYDEDILRKAGSIGKPTAFTEARVVDRYMKDVLPGQMGELVIRSPRLMKEYAFNPGMTRKTIINGWLKTGDLVYMDEEGYLFFTERAKDLIIRGGENIYPAEVEDILRKHPKIQDAAVLGYPHHRLGEIALAIIQLRPGQEMTEQEVIQFVGNAGLAKFKWPEKIIFAPVPRNPAGKIEKPLLRETYVKPAQEALRQEFGQKS